jgi:hypothetical protein
MSTQLKPTDNIDPKFWGEPGWIFLESICASYPVNPTEKDKKIIKEFFLLLPFVLPCCICREHNGEHQNQMPIDDYLSSRDKLMEWIYIQKDLTNKAIKKKTDITLAKFIKKIEMHRLYK